MEGIRVERQGCVETNTEDENEDETSVISERCWEERHRGDSRKWLIRDGYPKKFRARLISTMKETYPYPFQEEKRYVGDRRAALLDQLYQEATEEIIREKNEPPPVQEYCTEYDGNFNAAGFEPAERTELEENLCEKYPLYTSNAMSFWNFRLEQSHGSKVSMNGLTRSVDLKNPFRRHSGFSKPISEVLDEASI